MLLTTAEHDIYRFICAMSYISSVRLCHQYTSVVGAKRKQNQQNPNPGTNNVHQVSEWQKLLLMLPADHQHGESSSIRGRDQLHQAE